MHCGRKLDKINRLIYIYEPDYFITPLETELKSNKVKKKLCLSLYQMIENHACEMKRSLYLSLQGD